MIKRIIESMAIQGIIQSIMIKRITESMAIRRIIERYNHKDDYRMYKKEVYC